MTSKPSSAVCVPCRQRTINYNKIIYVQAHMENEEGKRVAEQQSFANEEAAEQLESQLEEG